MNKSAITTKKTNKIKKDLERDDMIFVPYMPDDEHEHDGYQCKMETRDGTISVRYKGYGLIVDSDRPYKVWYPTDDAPTGYQTAEDIFNYVKQQKQRREILINNHEKK